MRACSALMVVLVAVMLAACDKPGPATVSSAPSDISSATNEPTATDSAQPTTAIVPRTLEVKKVDASGFALGGYLPPLEGGKLEVAPPAAWDVMPRDSNYVVRFYDKSGGGGLPRIDVTVDESNLGGLTKVTEANVAEFTVAVAEGLKASGTAVVEPPIPMVIGTTPCARYVSHLKLKIGAGTLLVERQSLELLHDGRRYKINLLVLPGKLLDSRDAAYAVCAGIRFLDVASQTSE